MVTNERIGRGRSGQVVASISGLFFKSSPDLNGVVTGGDMTSSQREVDIEFVRSSGGGDVDNSR